jgi:hypothetical protein
MPRKGEATSLDEPPWWALGPAAVSACEDDVKFMLRQCGNVRDPDRMARCLWECTDAYLRARSGVTPLASGPAFAGVVADCVRRSDETKVLQHCVFVPPKDALDLEQAQCDKKCELAVSDRRRERLQAHPR